jgi:alkyl sulfatase BDS1-like metallo-beta-lactamase superfamily hydrolase
VGASEVTPTVAAANAAVAKAVDLSDPASFADAKRGLIAAPESGQVKTADGKLVWDFDAFKFVQGNTPATVNPSLWRQALLNNQVGLFKVAEGIYQLRGFDLANISLIEGKTGWIVVDPGTSRESAAVAMAFARKHLGDAKVTGMVFTHSHPDHFGGALGVLSAEEMQERKVPVVAPAGFMEEVTSEMVLNGVAMGRRGQYMYGMHLPRSATGKVDDGLGKDSAWGSIGLLPPSIVVEQPRQELEIDGRKFIFYNVPSSEAPSEFVFYLPELKAFNGAEMMSQTLHNLYTLRGAKVRDGLKWARYLDTSLEWAKDADVLFNQHHWPVWGKERISQSISMQRDTYKYIHDQTVRQINAGKTGPEIAETLSMPPAIQNFLNVRGYYGTVSHNVKAVYQMYMGWYDANPANLNPHPPVEAAKRYIDMAGGADKVIAHAQAAYDQGDFRWTAEALKHVVYADPKNARAKELQAKAFEQMAYMAESAPWRNAYLMGALELRNGPPETAPGLTLVQEMLRHVPPERFLERMAASIDGTKAAEMLMTINLVFSDDNESHVLRLENGVLHHRKAPPAADANATLTLTRTFFLQMMTGQVGAKDLLLSDQTKIGGSTIDLARFLALIEKAPGNFPIVTRELNH